MNELNGKAFVEAMLLAQAKKENNTETAALMTIFQKYGLTLMDGMAMLLELGAVLGGDKGD